MSILQNLIEQHPSITCFVHQHPDADALSAMYSINTFIANNYPEKRIFNVLSNDQEIDRESLGIILDCSSSGRILGDKFINCKNLLVIDHHPNSEMLSNFQVIDVNAASTCELLAELLLKITNKLSSITAYWLYRGIISDTLNFTTSSTTEKTLKVASQLLEFGVNLQEVQKSLFYIDERQFRYCNEIRKIAIFEKNIIHVTISWSEVVKAGVTMEFVKECIKEFTNIENIELVVLFYENSQGTWNASIRSKSVAINRIAGNFNGGGHAFASGCKDLSSKMKEDLLQCLREVSKNAKSV